jgi:NAD(P)H dehydrogenase (quinone)
VILVTGATGRVGYHLMEALADANAEVTAMVRVAARAADLPGTPGHVVATLDEPPPAAELRQFDQIFLLSPEVQEQAELETVFADAVAAAGHRPHVVKLCADGFQDPGCEVRFMRAHRQVAAHLDALGLPVTYLAAASYMEDLADGADAIRDTGTIAAPAGHGAVGWIAATDVARAAARVLTSPGHEDAIYVLTGPDKLTYAQVAARFSEVFAHRVDYRDEPAAQARERLLAAGRAPWEADGELERYAWISDGGAATVTGTVAGLTGSQPRPLAEWLGDERARFLT